MLTLFADEVLAARAVPLGLMLMTTDWTLADNPAGEDAGMSDYSLPPVDDANTRSGAAKHSRLPAPRLNRADLGFGEDLMDSGITDITSISDDGEQGPLETMPTRPKSSHIKPNTESSTLVSHQRRCSDCGHESCHPSVACGFGH